MNRDQLKINSIDLQKSGEGHPQYIFGDGFKSPLPIEDFNLYVEV